jgi:hypothetical protein
MSLGEERRRRCRRLQLKIVDVDNELDYISKLYPDIRQTIDSARDLLGRYSHLLHGVNVAEFCSLQKHARAEEEVAA